MFVVVFILLPLFLLWNVKSRTYETGNSKVDPNRTKAKAFKVASWIPVAIALVGVVGALASLSVFPGNAAKYASVLETQDADFAQDIQQVDYSEIPIIDRDSAALLGNRAMGNIPEYVSQFEIAGTYSQINYQGTPVRVSPLGYADLFKWLTNRGLFGGTTIERVVMVNATTGECTDLAIDDVPQWVDRAYPAELLIQQYNWSGKYQDGWLNSWLGQKNVVQTTPGTDGNVGYNYIAKDDDVWVYTGVTSATADNSIVGFVLVNQRTAESHYYPVAGATEESAMQSAEGAVQNLRYSATFPILINVSEQPTYFMALKDNAGTVKKFAMVDIQHYQNVATGDTVAETQKSYQAMLATSGTLSGDAAEANMQEQTGAIRSMTQAVLDGNSHFYVTLEGVEGIYDFALPAQLGIVGYREGDTITFKYIAGDTTNSVQELVDTQNKSDIIDKSSSEQAAKTVERTAETADQQKTEQQQ